MAETILVNFRRSIPLFPLPETVLLPHALLPLHIFEARYRQMVRSCLDCAGQIAIATIGRSGTVDGDGAQVRPVACVGQIIHHEALANGRFNICLHGVCRARIKQVIEPDDDRRFRLARLAPLDPLDEEPDPMPEVREILRRRLSGPSLQRLRDQNAFLEWIEREDVPIQAVLELIGSRLLPGADLKYRMLAETDPRRRARLVIDQLEHFRRVLLAAGRQNAEEWPKGVSWN